MNENKFTPGPWYAEKDNSAEVWDIKCDRGNGTVAMTDTWTPEIDKANAILIASAPDLLAACEAAGCYLRMHNMTGIHTRLLVEINNAINKAKGE